jgi:hypothetical protein
MILSICRVLMRMCACGPDDFDSGLIFLGDKCHGNMMGCHVDMHTYR